MIRVICNPIAGIYIGNIGVCQLRRQIINKAGKVKKEIATAYGLAMTFGFPFSRE
jgi:hypothetical protein